MTINIAEQQPREQLTFRMPYGALAYKETSEMCRYKTSRDRVAVVYASAFWRRPKRVGRRHEVVDGPAGQWFCLRKTALFHQDVQWVPWRLTASSGQSAPPVCYASAHGVLHGTSVAQLFLLPGRVPPNHGGAFLFVAWPTTRGRLGRRAIPCHVGGAGTSVDPAAFSGGPSLAHAGRIDAFSNHPDVSW
ncbi:hypothetical protein T06_7266 [Trichinella sp. T6]|nr:hypothetical protein T06_7266 [Trichinella sp. T6]